MSIQRHVHYFLIVASAFAVGAAAWSAHEIRLDWRAGHAAMGYWLHGINWVAYRTELAGMKLKRSLLTPSEPGLATVRLYVPEKSRQALMDLPPTSTKRWQTGYMLYPDEKVKRVKVRHRGDNPFNWVFDKKTWRIKTGKKRMINGIRVRNYALPQNQYLAFEVSAMKIGESLGLMLPKSRLIEMFINDESYGIYTEFEHVDESFLRNRNIMPVNIYKGESNRTEQALGVEHTYFNNPGIWEKTSVNNHLPADSSADLKFLLDLIRSAETSEQDMVRLDRFISKDQWLPFAVFQIVTQNLHNDAVHNLRIAYDTWSGHAFPIPVDVGVETEHERFLDAGSHELLRLLNSRSDFLWGKYQLLYASLKDERVLQHERQRLQKQRQALRRSAERDVHLIQHEHYGEANIEMSSIAQVVRNHDKLINGIADIEEWLLETLEARPDASWVPHNGGMRLVVDGRVPVAGLQFREMDPAGGRLRAFWDQNGDGVAGSEEHELPLKVSGGTVTVDTVWLANRIFHPEVRSELGSAINVGGYNRSDTRATRFDIIFNRAVRPQDVRAANALNGKFVPLEKKQRKSTVPGRWTYPVFEKPARPTIQFSGDMLVERDRIVLDDINILAGTTIRMAEGASLIFRGQVRVHGTETAPVKILPAKTGAPWGVFALQGRGTDGSTLNHLHLEGGSGDWVDNIRYTAMLSLHDTQDVDVIRVVMDRNKLVDDMMHVVYGHNIRLVDILFTNALSDAIDIDISDVRIEGGKIDRSGNDGIDLMSSSAWIERVTVEHSGDKGISVGEASQAVVSNTKLNRNAIGIESKDGSKVQVLHSDFLDNKIQVSAYRKNWRYSAGGEVDVRRSLFSGQDDAFSIRKGSHLIIRDSTVLPPPKNTKRVSIGKNVDFSEERRVRETTLGDDLLLPLPDKSGAALSNTRGAEH